MRTTFGTAKRLFIAFTLLVSTFAVASYLTLAHVRQIHDGLLQMKDHEEGVRVALELASAVRDQYAHQAHTIILGNDSHLPLYTDAERHVTTLTARVRKHALRADERAWVADIERATGDLDRIFRGQIVPAVLRHDVADVQSEHGRAQAVVTLIQDRADRLVDRFEASIGDFQREVAALQTSAYRWTVFFVLFAPLLAVVVGAYVLRSVARPVARLQAGAARLARGDLDTRFDTDAPDEFGALARQFNAMTVALKDHQEKLVQSEKLAGIGRLAAGVAHEINNPLAVILGYARLLRRKADGAAAEDLKVIEDETLRAKLIVDGLLDLSRPLASEPEPVDLRALCDDAIARLRETRLLEELGVRVIVTGAGEVQGHPQKLRQVVLNLVKNAAEAAGEAGRVEVRVEGAPDGARVVVRDTGPGLSRDARAKLFEPFFTTKDTGTGLGLAVSKGIVHAHGGEIDAESLADGGAEFTIRLPAVPPGRV
ncbi:sensor histidine kinase [Anaeromyxobacter terrae]|uniref:sensor histidine kinase n=1 Tax=Anaeromyxobacter terrae TaxID=2925406 RepID=UPI001F59ED8B|nr:HAMP domain-containing sensor histidine kinase [Anaeromyxobacter sp. SG22]